MFPSCRINVQPSAWLQGADLIPSQRFQETINTLPTPSLAFCPYFLLRAGICSPLWVRADFQRPRWQLLELCWPQRHVGRTEGEAATWRPCLEHLPWPGGELWPASCPAGAIELFFYLPLAWASLGGSRLDPPSPGRSSRDPILVAGCAGSFQSRARTGDGGGGKCRRGAAPPRDLAAERRGPPDPPHPGAAVAEPPGPGLGLEPLRLAEPPGLGASGEAEPGSGFPEPRSPSGSGRGVLEEPRGGWVERWLQGARRSPRGWLRARCRQRCPVKGRAFIRKFGFFLLLRKAKPRGGREVPPLGGAPKDARGWDATKLLYGMS